MLKNSNAEHRTPNSRLAKPPEFKEMGKIVGTVNPDIMPFSKIRSFECNYTTVEGSINKPPLQHASCVGIVCERGVFVFHYFLTPQSVRTIYSATPKHYIIDRVR